MVCTSNCLVSVYGLTKYTHNTKFIDEQKIHTVNMLCNVLLLFTQVRCMFESKVQSDSWSISVVRKACASSNPKGTDLSINANESFHWILVNIHTILLSKERITLDKSLSAQIWLLQILQIGKARLF